MKTYLFFESSLPTFAGSFCAIYFGVKEESVALQMALGWVEAPQQPPFAVLITTDLCYPCKSFHEPHAIVTHLVLMKGNLVPTALAVLGNVNYVKRTGCILHWRPAVLEYNNNTFKCS